MLFNRPVHYESIICSIALFLTFKRFHQKANVNLVYFEALYQVHLVWIEILTFLGLYFGK